MTRSARSVLTFAAGGEAHAVVEASDILIMVP